MSQQKAVLEVGAILANGTKQAFKSVADGFREVAKGMTANAAALRKMGQEASSDALLKTAKAINKVSKNIEDQTKDLGDLTTAQDKSTASSKKSTQAIEDATAALVKEGRELEKKEVQAKKLSAFFSKAHTINIKERKEAAKEAERAAKAEEKQAESSARLMAKKVELARHLQITYNKLVDGNTRWAAAARLTLKELKEGNMEMGVARDNISFLNKKHKEFTSTQQKSATSYAKMADALRRLTSLHPKEAAALAASNKSYQKQIDTLKRLDQFRQRAATKSLALSLKESAANEKVRLSIEKLSNKYFSLLAAGGKVSVSAQKIILSLNKVGVSASGADAHLKKLQLSYKESGTAATKTASQYQKLRSSFPDFSKQISALRKTTLSYEEQVKVLTRLTLARKQAAAQKVISDKQLKAARDLSLRYKELVNGGDRYARAAKKIDVALKAQSISADKAARSFKNLALMQKQAFNAMTPLQQATQRLSKSFQSYMSYMAASSIIFGVIRSFQAATTTIIDYDQALKDLQAVTQATGDDMEAMDVKIRQVASDTKFSAIEIADGMKLLGQAGFSVQESINTIDAVSNLATGTLTSMATTVDLVTTALRVFNIDSADSARVADVFANAVNGSKLTIDKMRVAMNYIGPVANAAGAEFEEVASAMMVMANQGIRASTMGTGLRQVFRRLVDPSAALVQGLAAAGLGIEDLDLNSHSLIDVLDKLKLVVKDNQAAFKMFGVRGSTAILSLIKEIDIGSLVDMMETVRVSGTAADMAAVQMQGLGVSFKNLQDKIKNFYLAMGDSGATGALRMFVDAARGLVDFMTAAFSNSLVQVASKFILAAGAAQAFVVVLKMLASTSFAKAIFAPLIAGSTAYTTSIGTATTATWSFAAAGKALKAVLLTIWPAALVVGLVSFITYITGIDDKLKASVIALKAERKAIQDNITALDLYVSALEDVDRTMADKQILMQKLITTYPGMAAGLAAAGGDMAKVVEVIKNYNAELEKDKSKTYVEEIKANFKLLQIAAHKSKTSGGFFESNAEEEARRKKFKEDNISTINEIVTKFNVAKKHIDGLTMEDFYKDLFKDGGSKGVTISLVNEHMADVAEATKTASETAGEQTGEAFVDGIKKGLSTASDLSSDFKEAGEAVQTQVAKDLRDVAVLKAQGLLTEEQAEKKSVAIKLAGSQEKLAIARQFAADMNDAVEVKEGDIEKSLKAEADAYQKVLADELTMIESFGTKRKKLLDEVAGYEKKKKKEVADYNKSVSKSAADAEKLIEDNTKAVADKRVDIAKDYASKVKEIEKALADKIISLQEKIQSSREKTASDVASIGDTTRDKVLNIRQRDMSDAKKASTTAAAAASRLQEGKRALAEASKTQDKEALDRATALIEKSGEYYESLEDSNAAVKGLQKVGAALQQARQAAGDIEEAAYQKQIKKEETEAARKVKLAADTTAEQLKDFITKQKEKLDSALLVIKRQREAEDIRHKEVMANINDEIAKRNQEASNIKARQDQVISSSDQGMERAPAPGEDGSDYWLPEGWADEQGKKVGEAVKGAVADAEKAVSKSVEDAVKEGVTTGVQKGMFDSVLVDGVPLEEWAKKGTEAGDAQGEAQGKALADSMTKAFNIETGVDGEPLSVTIADVKPEDLVALTDEIQKALNEYPGKPVLDFAPAERAIQAFISTANSKYKISIPVETKSKGGPVVGMSKGGRLPGQDSPTDKVHVLARPGEWFIKNESVKQWSNSVGDWFMKGVNWPGSSEGKRLHELLDLNGSLRTQNRNIRELATSAAYGGGGPNQDMADFGTVNLNFPSKGPAIPVMMKANDVNNFLNEMKRMEDFAA